MIKHQIHLAAAAPYDDARPDLQNVHHCSDGQFWEAANGYIYARVPSRLEQEIDYDLYIPAEAFAVSQAVNYPFEIKGSSLATLGNIKFETLPNPGYVNSAKIVQTFGEKIKIQTLRHDEWLNLIDFLTKDYDIIPASFFTEINETDTRVAIKIQSGNRAVRYTTGKNYQEYIVDDDCHTFGFRCFLDAYRLRLLVQAISANPQDMITLYVQNDPSLPVWLEGVSGAFGILMPMNSE